MTVDTASTIFEQFGVVGLVVIGFFVLVFWVMKTSQEREEKLYSIINKLADELPEIRNTLDELNDKVNKFERTYDSH